MANSIAIHPRLAERLDDALALAEEAGGILVCGRGVGLAIVIPPADMAARIQAARLAALNEIGGSPCAA